jgi:NADH-quinone oxidoreductase subunit G
VVLGTNNIDFRCRATSDEESAFLALTQVHRNPLDTLDYAALERAKQVVLVSFEPEDESPMIFLRLRKAVRKSGLRVVTVAPFLSNGSRKLAATLVPTAPGQEADVLRRIGVHFDSDTLILVGERAAASPGTLSGVVELADVKQVKYAWIPRRSGELAAVAAGCLPTLFPGGRPVTDAGARADLRNMWQVDQLPMGVGYDLNGILNQTLRGEITKLVLGGVDLRDLPHPELGLAALDAAQFVLSLETHPTEVTSFADVVLPVASLYEQAGTFIDWTHQWRAVAPVIPGTAAPLNDLRLLAALADALGADLRMRDVAAARASFDLANTWVASPQAMPRMQVPPSKSRQEGNVTLASWRVLIDDAKSLAGAEALSKSAPQVAVKMSPATAARAGLSVGSVAMLQSGQVSWVGPVDLVSDMIDGVVWIPSKSQMARYGRLPALPGDRVQLSVGGVA